MTLSDLGTPWLLPTFSLLTATISNIISPNGRKSFVEDVKSNILDFSPFRFGATATALVLELIGCRLLNLAEIRITLGLLGLYNHTPDLERGFWSRFARRAFLIGATLPLYMMLLASASHRWIQVFATLLVAEAVLAEIFTFYQRTSFEVRRDWPRRVLLVKSLVPLDYLNHAHFENESKPSEFGGNEEHGDVLPPSALRDNLCDRVHQLWPLAAEPLKSASHFLPLENTPKLKKIFDPTVRPQWTCGHWRCLVYMILLVAIRAVASSWAIIELASTIWMLHCELQPVTLKVACKLSQSNLVYGLLSTLYQVCALVLIVIFIYISLGMLLNRLFMPLFTRLSKQNRILQRMQQKFQDLAETAPITHSILNVLRARLIQSILCFYFGRVLSPQLDLQFTQEIFSYIIEIIAIPTIQVMIYWLVCIVTRTEQAPPELESHFNAGQSSEPSIATDSNCEGTQNPAATESRSTPSIDEKKASKDGSESSRTLKGFRLTIVRLTILVATATIWIFLFL